MYSLTIEVAVEENETHFTITPRSLIMSEEIKVIKECEYEYTEVKRRGFVKNLAMLRDNTTNRRYVIWKNMYNGKVYIS